jgi:hypothetical protein
VAKGQPVTSAIPPAPVRPTPVQPPGRAPLHRGTDAHVGQTSPEYESAR